MDFNLQALMAQATQLTRNGQLAEAGALLRNAMGAGAGGTAGAGPMTAPMTAPMTGPMTGQVPGWPAGLPASQVIDVVARRVDGGGEAGGKPAGQAAEAADRVVGAKAATGGFTSHRFANAADRRDYKLFLPAVPADAAATPMPLVVMLHGCTQNPDDFAAGTRMNQLAQAQGFAVLYPAQSAQANPQGCWNWFKHTHQERDRGEPALIAGMVREVAAAHAIDPKRIYVAGLSAGGAMAAIMGDTHPEMFAAVGVHSGLAAGAARDLPSALSAMKSGTAGRTPAGSGKPTIVFQGEADTTVHPRNARSVIAASVGDAIAAKGEATVVAGRRSARKEIFRGADGAVAAELWLVQGAPHAWSGGGAGSYTDPTGPDASGEMVRFFLAHPLA